MTVMTLDQLTQIVNNVLGRTDLLIETSDEDDSELLVVIPKAEAKGMTQDRWQAIYNDLSEATEAPVSFDQHEDGVAIHLGLRVNYNLHQDGTHLDFI
jgi:ABC-type phosphate/phosphonate transport system substrate-binding protein